MIHLVLSTPSWDQLQGFSLKFGANVVFRACVDNRMRVRGEIETLIDIIEQEDLDKAMQIKQYTGVIKDALKVVEFCVGNGLVVLYVALAKQVVVSVHVLQRSGHFWRMWLTRRRA